MSRIVTNSRTRPRSEKRVGTGYFVPRGRASIPARATAAALVAAGACMSGVMGTGAATAAAARPASLAAAGRPASPARPASLAAAARPASHPGVPRYARTITVTSLSSAGPGSLRAAITRANLSRAGRATLIRFAVRGTITLSRPLPAVSANVTINGASAPGYVRGGAPVVEIDANGQAGLEFAPGSSGAQLLGLAVDDAGGDGITLEASDITLDHNYIGLNRSGASFGNGGDGVFVAASSEGNTIGENPAGTSGAVSNVISGNAGNGITLSGSSVNTVAANRIGTNAAGTSAIPNRDNGLAIVGRSQANEVGGTVFVDSATGKANNPTGSKGTVTPVFVVPPDGNLISGNGLSGVLIDDGAGYYELNGNFIGTTARGDATLGNGASGVWIDGADHNSLVGCKFVNNPFVYYNVISGNKQNGLRVTNASDTVVQGDFFGTGANNTAIVQNALNGILVQGSSAGTQVAA